MNQETVRVLWNSIECSGYFRMGLSASDAYVRAKAGQFVMIRFCEGLSPFLRRPFSIHRLIHKDGSIQGFEILYKVVGKGTEKLSLCRKGERLDALGPLGNHFRLPGKSCRIFIAAGGIGVAPMYFLTESLLHQGRGLHECTVFIGGRSKDDLLCLNDFFSAGVETVHISTDDGSAGSCELVTGPLQRYIEKNRPDRIYACGPLPMLKSVADMAIPHQIPCQISVETVMACGMGACLGCAVRDKNDETRYLHACKDGPVFDVRKIDL
ncbi:MAG: dihydroorotate dehydrogenase electron transfer subunit [Desulfococcaceae bacterium]|jgi:dihydroorotate dehydrogenase electron transfer subunit|nr:dihydroorotate dehydrogenase electron transfer subunit [Desulfococcaceae bacterium]